jgi:hypothetical protein
MLLAVAALSLGVAITGIGFAFERQQMVLAIQTRSIRPICDPSRNAAISACLPVLALATRLGEYGVPAFLGFCLLNILLWAAAAYLPARRIPLFSPRADRVS